MATYSAARLIDFLIPCPVILQYEQKYMSKATSIGILGMEELTFMTYDQGTVSIPQTVFGCGGKNEGLGDGLLSGILGLGWKRVSLVYHIGSKFPYLEGISVGEEAPDINPEIFRRGPSGHGGVLIDSGTTTTYLHKGGYEPLRAKVERLIGSLFRRVTITEYQNLLCYKGSVSDDLKGFPVVTFYFAGGADLVLDVDALFEQATANTFCMFVEEAPAEPGSSSLTIIGIRAQQYYNVGYDLDAMKLYLQRIDCILLED